jgi:hypothetical protein
MLTLRYLQLKCELRIKRRRRLSLDSSLFRVQALACRVEEKRDPRGKPGNYTKLVVLVGVNSWIVFRRRRKLKLEL